MYAFASCKSPNSSKIYTQNTIKKRKQLARKKRTRRQNPQERQMKDIDMDRFCSIKTENHIFSASTLYSFDTHRKCLTHIRPHLKQKMDDVCHQSFQRRPRYQFALYVLQHIVIFLYYSLPAEVL